MFRKFGCLLLFLFIPINVLASANSGFMIGSTNYDTLEEAIVNAKSGDTITLLSDSQLSDTIVIDKVLNLRLNGNNISSLERVFEVDGGTLNVSGPGTIKEINPNYGAIVVKGGSDPDDYNYSSVNVSDDVILEGWSGIFITHNNSSGYGVEVNMDGKINAVDDVNGGPGAGVYVNGNIKHKDNVPVVNIGDNASITSTGNGLYIAGYAIFNIGKAYISGVESGIGIKAGVLNIEGADVVCLGEDKTPSSGYNNGIKPSGTTIQIESNSGYAGDIELNIDSGNFNSKNSNVIYEYIGAGDKSLVKDINISSGKFVSDANKEVFRVSDSFSDMHKGFIVGGSYSSNPSLFLKDGYSSKLDGDIYRVVKNTMSEVSSNDISLDKKENSVSFLGIFGIILVILFVLVFMYRKKIFGVLKK